MGIDLGMSGLASGFDWKAFVDQMVQAERAPQAVLRFRQNRIQQQNAAFAAIETRLTALQEKLKALKEPSLYDRRTVQSSAAGTAAATAEAGTPLGTFVFQIKQLATASRINGAGNVGQALCPTGDPSSLALSDAGWPAPISAGTFTVNGAQVTVALTDTLQQVFDKISAATSGAVNAAYDAASDRIVLASTGEIVLGSATDTSNFLRAARLANNGTGTVASSLALGGIRTRTTLASAGFATAVNDGGAGAGEFKINGVSIAYNATTDTVAALVERINNSQAGVAAAYDARNDRFVLTSKVTGDMGIALQDVTGNFLAAAGLAGGALVRGQDLRYTVNDGPELTSPSNTITEATSGIAGLAVTALQASASVSISVASDTAAVRGAIDAFVAAYNDLQSYIDKETASSTNSEGAVTAGLLAGDSTADDVASDIRQAAFASINGLNGAVKRLADLGFQTSGYDNKLTLASSERLDAALANQLPAIKEFLADPANGLTVQLDTLLTRMLGDSSALQTRQDSFTRQVADITAQIARMEKTVLADQARMTRQFIAMETAQAKISQQLQYLMNNFK